MRAAPTALAVLDDAIGADLVIAEAVEAGERHIDRDEHPLGATVHQRTLTNLITWPFTGCYQPNCVTYPRLGLLGADPSPPGRCSVTASGHGSSTTSWSPRTRIRMRTPHCCDGKRSTSSDSIVARRRLSGSMRSSSERYAAPTAPITFHRG